jgi:hypothetical protein
MMNATQYRKKPPRTDLFCRNADGEIVVVSKVWKGHSKRTTAVSLYAVRGNIGKKLELVHRELFAKPDFNNEELLVARDTVALLWAMHFGIDNFVVVYQEPDMRRMFHPTELQQEMQP